jgi:ferrous iron transport protein B
MKRFSICLVGNPNCGKTTVFNALTGARQQVGNWPGVTVEKKTGQFASQHARIEVTDLPGTYSLEHESEDASEDERIAREYALRADSDLIVNVVDASNLHRNLFLTTQLLDLQRPMLVVLNMMDAVHDRGEQIDLVQLEAALGCPVLAISASRRRGIHELRHAIVEQAEAGRAPQPKLALTAGFAEAVDTLQQTLSVRLERWFVLEALQGVNLSAHPLTPADLALLEDAHARLAAPFDGELDIAIASARYEAINDVSDAVIRRPREAGISLTERLDRIALHRIWGVPLFFLVMYLMFMLSINVGSCFIDFFDILVGTVVVDGSTHLLQMAGAPAWLDVVLAQGVGGGIRTVSTFIPVIAAMFLCLSFLEDSGYLARAAMVMDRVMRVIGLPGKAFVPMLVGFGCNVPAIMGTRTLDSTRDRLLSIMMIPYMSCGARLPVYALFAAAFFPYNGQNVVFALYLTGVAVAALTGLVLKHTLLPGKATAFVMELPPYRMPTLRGLSLRVWDRLKGFILRAGQAIVIVVTLLSLLNSLGTDGSFGNENTERSLLSTVSRELTPVFRPMGIQPQNWPATVGIFTGIFAKETVIGTLDSLYSTMGRAQAGHDAAAAPYDLVAGVHKALATIPEQFGELAQTLSDPLKMNVGDVTNQAEAAKEREVHTSTFGQMRMLFGSSAAGMAYLLFVLLYLPCVAAMGAVYRETNLRWTSLVAVWSFAMAWGGSTLYYQAAQLAGGVDGALDWLVGIPLVAAALVLLLRWYGRRPGRLPLQAAPAGGACGKDGGCGCC